MLVDRGVRLVLYPGWTSIDELERAAGEKLGRPRVKLCSWDELLSAAEKSSDRSLSGLVRTPLHSNVSKTEPKELWGVETAKAVANFPVSGEPIPPPVARWLGRIKGAAAQRERRPRLARPRQGRPDRRRRRAHREW